MLINTASEVCCKRMCSSEKQYACALNISYSSVVASTILGFRSTQAILYNIIQVCKHYNLQYSPLSKCSACAQEHQLKIDELAPNHPHLPVMAYVVVVLVHYQTAVHALLLLGMPAHLMVIAVAVAAVAA
jgi:hypothetical protein